MGMFDIYRTVPPIRCPLTGAVIAKFQGKCSRCAGDVWVQGQKEPAQRSPGAGTMVFTSEEEAMNLPEMFSIHTSHDGKWYEVECRCEDGVWTKAELITVDELGAQGKRLYERR